MLRLTRILLLALLAILGLAACSSVSVVQEDNAAASDTTVSDAVEAESAIGRPRFLISYADW